MYIIAGLGNPGKRYERTRHNLGFITIDHLADQWKVAVERNKFQALVGETHREGEKILLAKPQTYMNRSGDALREMVSFYKVEPERLLLIYDDLDIPLGSLRIRKQGSAGTHNGMRSVIGQLGFDDFPRIRIGIGDHEDRNIIDYVTGGFLPEEEEPVFRAVERACQAIDCYLHQGIEIAMSRYNGKD